MIEFVACPDCGCRDDYPEFTRERSLYDGSTIVYRSVYAECKVCGWRTNVHSTVAKCAEEWNNSGMNKKESPQIKGWKINAGADKVEVTFTDGTTESFDFNEFERIEKEEVEI